MARTGIAKLNGDRAYYRRHRERILAKRREERQIDPTRFRRARKMSTYRITQEHYESLMGQERCGACGTPLSSDQDKCIDHNHQTGQVRGVLCGPCNRTLGHSKESVPRLRAVIAYLEKTE